MRCNQIKKYRQGKIRFVMLKKLGDSFVTSDISEADVVEVWKSVGAT